jgi:4-carboxymuconolactone decarboxylase
LRTAVEHAVLAASDDTTNEGEETAMADQASDSPILDLLTTMNQAGIEASTLDVQSLMLVRMAALVAVDAPPVSYMLNLRMAGDVDVDATQVEGMLATIAPIVGSARVASAAGKMVRALGLEISLAELDEA